MKSVVGNENNIVITPVIARKTERRWKQKYKKTKVMEQATHCKSELTWRLNYTLNTSSEIIWASMFSKLLSNVAK